LQPALAGILLERQAGHDASQSVGAQFQVLQLLEVPQRLWDGPFDLVAAHLQVRQLLEVPQRVRDEAVDLVAVQV
jgi:hypothetical protein